MFATTLLTRYLATECGSVRHPMIKYHNDPMTRSSNDSILRVSAMNQDSWFVLYGGRELRHRGGFHLRGQRFGLVAAIVLGEIQGAFHAVDAFGDDINGVKARLHDRFRDADGAGDRAVGTWHFYRVQYFAQFFDDKKSVLFVGIGQHQGDAGGVIAHGNIVLPDVRAANL